MSKTTLPTSVPDLTGRLALVTGRASAQELPLVAGRRAARHSLAGASGERQQHLVGEPMRAPR